MEVELHIRPAFRFPLTIRFDEESFSYLGNLDIENSLLAVSNIENRYRLQQGEYEYLIGDIEKVAITPAPRFACGVDGDTSKISIANGWNKASYTWWGQWEKCPEGWEPLGDLLRRLVDFARKKRDGAQTQK